MPGFGGAVSSRQQSESVGEPGIDLGWIQRAQPRGSQFQCEWQPVQSRTDAPNECDRARVDGESRSRGGGPVGEQTYRGSAELFGQGRLGIRDRQLPDHENRFTGDPQRFAAGGQDPDARAVTQQPMHRPSGVVHQVLTVVEHDQQRPFGEQSRQLTVRIVVFGARAATQCRRDLPGDLATGRERRQVDEERLTECPGPGLQRQPCFAGAAGTGQRHQPRSGEQPRNLCQLIVTSDEVGQWRRPAAGSGRTGVGPQDFHVRLCEFL